ncbi:hypothetical protein BDY21DRAFT_349476 [Lineolata rhizophorae]|uniref:Uncharacterized protein n=1 Tax=Lineolata rhizophorae TaxID=578093 RepID=A0A6A6NUU3_9PEZI|nr:hypothetical protein BDY21DRAFT_349476 [Lineolata rhizophorae]
MRFLGLNPERFERGFDARDDLFAWCASGRFFDQPRVRDRIENSNDRRRARKRDMYRAFVDEWIPAHPEVGAADKGWTRESVLEEALSTFGKEPERDQKLGNLRRKVAEDALFGKIAEIVPKEGAKLNLVMRALKRWVVFVDGEPVVMREAELDPKKQATWSQVVPGEKRERLFKWVEEHWELVKNMEQKRTNKLKGERKAFKAASSVVTQEAD